MLGGARKWAPLSGKRAPSLWIDEAARARRGGCKEGVFHLNARIPKVLTLLLAFAFFVLPTAPAFAAKDAPPVLITAWYWEDQSRQRIQDPTTGTDVAVISVPNPFCPSPPLVGSPPEETCKAGRLPVEVREADYEKPNKLSAVAFDLALVPLGSKVGKFTVTFREASDEQSEPINAEGKSLQACLVEEFFGDGEAALYAEVPRYTCSETDPVAERKEIKVKEDPNDPNPAPEEPVFGYTFDLTSFAELWVAGETPISAVMLMPVRPKEADYDPATDANWRTVLTGPVEKGGVTTSLVYTPAKTPPVDPVPPVTPVDPGTSFDPGTSVTTGSGSVTPTDTGFDTPTSDTIDAPELPTDIAAEADPAGDTIDTGLPGYVWLAILAGFVAFNMVRSVVVESATGIRSDGVLAQIRKLNASRRGTEIPTETAAVAAGGVNSVIAGLKSLGGKSGALAGKIRLGGKKGS